MTTLSHLITTSRKRGVPLIALESLDPLSVEADIVTNANSIDCNLRWTSVLGLQGLDDKGAKAVTNILTSGQQAPPGFEGMVPDDPTKADPPAMFEMLWEKMPAKACIYVHMGHKLLEDARFLQGLQLTRQRFKSTRRQMVLIGPSFELPPEVSSDIIRFEDPLPTDEQLAATVAKIFKVVGQEPTDDDVGLCVGFCRGLTEFQAEQNLALSITTHGMDYKELAERRSSTIGNIRGLELYNPRITFDDLGGLTAIKEYMGLLFNGKTRFDLVVWLDEIEKSSLAHTGDTSGTNADQLGQVLSFMADEDVFGIALAGPPGSGKSYLCKALAGEFKTQVIRLDLGAVQDKYVGSSQRYLRMALRTIKHLGHKPLFICTANDLSAMDDALMSRFSDVFFFDMPDTEERAQSWEVNCLRYETQAPSLGLDDEGWSHRNIAKCCEKAAHFDLPAEQVAENWMISEDSRSRQRLERARRDADGRYLSASTPGVYRRTREATERNINLEE